MDLVTDTRVEEYEVEDLAVVDKAAVEDEVKSR